MTTTEQSSLAATRHDTPLGPLALEATEAGLARCVFVRRESPPPAGAPSSPARASGPAADWLDQARRELDEYFAGRRREFTVPVDQREVTPFDRSVLDALSGVGHGTTTTYGRLAAGLGLSGVAARDVGQALAHNPVLIVVPCHRVVGADGSLTGYAGGLPAKRWLLDHESDEPRLDLDLGLPH